MLISGLDAGLAPVEKAEIDLTANEEHGVADYLASIPSLL